MLSKEKDGFNTRKVDTLIGKETSFKGNLEAQGGGASVRIDGYFEGELNIAGDLIIGETGKVVGNLVAKNITVAGEVKGNIEARAKLELQPSAKVIADARMVTLIVEDGAFLQGLCSPLSRENLKERGKSLMAEPPKPANEKEVKK